MTTIQGKYGIFGTSALPGVPIVFTLHDPVTLAAISGFVSPVINTAQITHASNSDTLSENGEIVGVAYFGETLSATFEMIPAGTTLAASVANATLPKIGSSVEISGADIIAIGTFTDAINTTGGNRWIYPGGGSLNESGDGKVTMSLPLMRYPAIPATTAAVIS